MLDFYVGFSLYSSLKKEMNLLLFERNEKNIHKRAICSIHHMLNSMITVDVGCTKFVDIVNNNSSVHFEYD